MEIPVHEKTDVADVQSRALLHMTCMHQVWASGGDQELRCVWMAIKAQHRDSSFIKNEEKFLKFPIHLFCSLTSQLCCLRLASAQR